MRRKLKGCQVTDMEWEFLCRIGSLVDQKTNVSHLVESRQDEYFKARILFILVAKRFSTTNRALADYFGFSENGIVHALKRKNLVLNNIEMSVFFSEICEEINKSVSLPKVRLNRLSRKPKAPPYSDLGRVPTTRELNLMEKVSNDINKRMGLDPLLMAKTTNYVEVRIMFSLVCLALGIGRGPIAYYLGITRASIRNYINRDYYVKDNISLNSIYEEVLKFFEVSDMDNNEAVYRLLVENKALKQKIQSMSSPVPFEEQIRQLNPKQLNNLTIRLEAFFKML